MNVESFYAIHDLLSSLFARIAFPERPAESWEFKPPGPVSYAFDKVDLFKFQRELESCFAPLSDLETTNDTRTRAIEAITRMVELKFDTEFLKQLPLAMSMPLREAARTCQVSPPPDWPLAAYRLVGRDELAESAIDESEPLSKDGYRTVKDHLVCSFLSSQCTSNLYIYRARKETESHTTLSRRKRTRKYTMLMTYLQALRWTKMAF